MKHISELKRRYPKRKQPTPETRLKRACTRLMKQLGIFSYPVTQGLGCHPGLPDRVAHHQGRVIYLEFKAGKNRLSPHQKAFMWQCEADGVEYHVIRSVDDLEDALAIPTLFNNAGRRSQLAQDSTKQVKA